MMAGKKKKNRSKSIDKSKSVEPKAAPAFEFPEEAVPAYVPPPPVSGQQVGLYKH